MPIVLADAPSSNPYLQAVDLIGELDGLLAADRMARNLTVAQQAKLIGIGSTTLANIGPETNSSEATIVAELTYLSTL